MDKITRKALHRHLLVPFIVTLVAALMMVLCVFLPYATATNDYAERLDKYPDVMMMEDMEMTAKDVKHLSMAEYANIYYTMRNELWRDPANGIFLAVLVGLIGGFSLITVLFALGRKPIATIIFAALAYGVFAVQNFDYTDRGVIPSNSYDWGIAHTLFPIAVIVVVIGAFWMLAKKSVFRMEIRRETPVAPAEEQPTE